MFVNIVSVKKASRSALASQDSLPTAVKKKKTSFYLHCSKAFDILAQLLSLTLASRLI
jgi:hypothetical protein